MRVLLIEDHAELAQRMTERLGQSGFIVGVAPDAETAQQWPSPETLAAIIVDLGLPGQGGLDFIRWWRGERRTTPILVQSGRSNWEDRVEALNAGADDYVVKPCRSEEIVARLEALLRRSSDQADPTLQNANLTLNPATKTVTLNGEMIGLTQIEYKLLHLFMHRPNHTLSKGDILEHLYPAEADRHRNTVEVHVGRLRRKIGDDKVVNVHGMGYRMNR